MSKTKKNVFSRKYEWGFWFVGITYILMTPIVHFLMYLEGQYTNKCIDSLRETLKVVTTTNITVTLGLGALLFTVVTVNNKVNTNVKIKEDLITITRPFLMFILLNSVIVIMSGLDSFVLSIVPVFMQLITSIVLFQMMLLIYKFIKKILTSV